MCNPACLQFVADRLRAEEVRGRRVLEVGARNVNGSARPLVERLQPASYLGIDLAPGTGVDEICDIADLAARYGRESFDLVVTTELLEHVYDWRLAVANLKSVLAPGGILLVTTRSRGFRYHGYPYDFWRYGVRDLAAIFSDLAVEAIEKDPLSPGVFFKGRKPVPFAENDLRGHALYSIINKRRCLAVGELEMRAYMFYRRLRAARKKRLGG